MDTNLILPLFLIFVGAAILSTAALIARQSLLIAYILIGILIGPWGLKWIGNIEMIHGVGDIGILFLLFLLGLHLPPGKLLHMLKKASVITFVSSVIFGLSGYGMAWVMGLNMTNCLIVASAMIFSSTIIGIKLLPTTVLHHQHTGEVMISVLLLQDLLAIVVLLLINGATNLSAHGMVYNKVWHEILLVLIGFPALLLITFVLERFLLVKLFSRFNRIKEYIFLLSIAWCLGIAELATLLKLSSEIGAFLAGVSLANRPISLYIAESLKPIRDFFLVMFFFAVGATFNLNYLSSILLPASLLAVILLLLKPFVYQWLLQTVGEIKEVAWEVGVRLGQISEFSLIIAYVSLDLKFIEPTTAYLIEATAIFTFIISSYWVVLRFPTPMAVSDRLRRD